MRQRMSKPAATKTTHRTRPRTLAVARKLRSEMTEAEKRIWYFLRANRFSGVRFKRQVPIGPFNVDFACLSEELVIELDGGQHDADAARDAKRAAWLESQGFRVMRFWNNEVFENLDTVLRAIDLAIGGQARRDRVKK